MSRIEDRKTINDDRGYAKNHRIPLPGSLAWCLPVVRDRKTISERAMNGLLKDELLRLKQRETEFSHLVECSSREDLARCAKFLAMYIALYRQKFGDIPAAGYDRLMQTTELDPELLSLIDGGISEAAEMLKLVLMQKKTANLDDELPGKVLN